MLSAPPAYQPLKSREALLLATENSIWQLTFSRTTSGQKGQTATYELVDPETERQQATCPSCGVYVASKDEMEDACDAD